MGGFSGFENVRKGRKLETHWERQRQQIEEPEGSEAFSRERIEHMVSRVLTKLTGEDSIESLVCDQVRGNR